MPRLLPWLVGAFLIGAATDAAAEAERRAGGSPHVVRLAWTDLVGNMAGGWLQAAQETSRVLAQLGARAESRVAPVSEPLSSDEIRVILVPGPPPRHAGGRSTIGAASSTGSIPRVWIRLDGIAEMLGASTPYHALSAPPEVVLRFDRLLGRVVAHETIHLLAPTITHGRGLMSACLDVNEFLRPDLRINSEVAALVQAAIRGDPIASPARDADTEEALIPAGP
jgi:hypothetical protein